MLFFGKKKKNEEKSNVVTEKTNLYQTNVNDINAPLPAASIPVVGQTIPTSSSEGGQTANPGVVMGPTAPVEPAPMSAPNPAAPVEPAPMPTPEPAAPVEPAPMPTPEPAAPVEPAPMPAPEPVVPVEPAPMPAPEPVAPVEPAPVQTAESDASNLNQSMFVDQPKPEPTTNQTEPKFCPNCGNKVEGDTCILCGTKI